MRMCVGLYPVWFFLDAATLLYLDHLWTLVPPIFFVMAISVACCVVPVLDVVEYSFDLVFVSSSVFHASELSYAVVGAVYCVVSVVGFSFDDEV